jgi:LysR family cyn operon transcriptional activator
MIKPSLLASQIELRHLRYFVALAEEQHFTRAAAAAHISQPTLSQQIRQLEAAVGSPLVDRIGKTVGLTAAGHTLLPFAREILHRLEEAGAAVAEHRGLRSGELSVAVVQTVNATLVPDLLARFSAAYPGIHVSTREVSGSELEAGVAGGSFDLGIGFSPAAAPGLSTERLYEEELKVIAPSRHPLAGRREVTVREVAAHPLVLLPRGYCTRELIQAAFSQVGLLPRVALELNSIDGILATIEQTGGLTLLPAFSVRSGGRRGLRTLRLTRPAPKRTVGLVWREGAFRKAAADAFAAIARAVAGERKRDASEARRRAA